MAKKTYTVKPGDNPLSLGAELGFSPQQLLALNGITSLTPGQTLQLPKVANAATPYATGDNNRAVFYGQGVPTRLSPNTTINTAAPERSWLSQFWDVMNGGSWDGENDTPSGLTGVRGSNPNPIKTIGLASPSYPPQPTPNVLTGNNDLIVTQTQSQNPHKWWENGFRFNYQNNYNTFANPLSMTNGQTTPLPTPSFMTQAMLPTAPNQAAMRLGQNTVIPPNTGIPQGNVGQTSASTSTASSGGGAPFTLPQGYVYGSDPTLDAQQRYNWNLQANPNWQGDVNTHIVPLTKGQVWEMKANSRRRRQAQGLVRVPGQGWVDGATASNGGATTGNASFTGISWRL